MTIGTPALVAVTLGVAIGALGRLARLDRDRAMYPVALVVIGSYYVLFATMGGGPRVVWSESVGAIMFAAIAIIGFRTSLWWVVGGTAGHGVFDWVAHHRLVENPGMPTWWPTFCGTIDIVLAAVLAVLLLARAIPARMEPGSR